MRISVILFPLSLSFFFSYVLDFVHRLTLLNNTKLLIHVRKHELCVLIMKQGTAVWLHNGLKCTV